jgi:hypothetical protein
MCIGLYRQFRVYLSHSYLCQITMTSTASWRSNTDSLMPIRIGFIWDWWSLESLGTEGNPTVTWKTAEGQRRFTTGHIRTYLLTYLLTYLFNPWSRIALENLSGLQLVKKFPAFYGILKFITAFTSVRHLSLSSASSIQSAPSHPLAKDPS